jgi:hypothetical protein
MDTSEYSEDIAEQLRTHDAARAEIREHIRVDTQQGTMKSRWACANMISNMAHSSNQTPDTIIAAIELLDRYVASSVGIPGVWHMDGLRELAGTLLVMASKLTAVRDVLEIEELIKFCGHRPKASLLAMELWIANSVKFAFPTPSAGYFFVVLADAVRLSRVARAIAELLMEISLSCTQLLGRSPLVLIAASIMAAQDAAHEKIVPFPEAVAKICGDGLIGVSLEIANVAKTMDRRNCLIVQQFPIAILAMVGIR